jgi:hypothetical protein
MFENGPSETFIYLVLGLRQSYTTDGERLLGLILERYGVWHEVYQVLYCYEEDPPSKIKERAGIRETARRYIESQWRRRPGIIIGLGWMACEVLTGKGKTKLKDTAGTKWKYAGELDQAVWVTYDPAAALFDPAVVVDIAAVIVEVGREIGLTMEVEEDETLSKMHAIWRKYL